MSDPVIVETGPEPLGSVIWLHGLGADGHDFEPLVPQLSLPADRPLRFVFPQAPVRPVTVNGGMAMRAWYDILSFDAAGRADESGLRASARTLESLIAAETARGVPASRIVLAGFSQGGAVALHTGLRYRPPLAGLLLLSTYLPLPDAFAAEVVAAAAKQPLSLPIFMAHGSVDPVLPLELGRESKARVETAGYRVQWHEYPMAHQLCAAEIDEIRGFLLAVYAKSPAFANPAMLG